MLKVRLSKNIKELLRKAISGKVYAGRLTAEELRSALTQTDELLRHMGKQPKQGLVFHLSGVTFEEPVILTNTTIPHVLHFKDCAFNRGMCINSAKLKTIHFVGGVFEGTLCMENAVIESSFKAEGVSFRGSRCSCSNQSEEHRPCCIRPTSRIHEQLSIYARDVEINGCCLLRKCVVEYEAFFAGAEIGGVLDLDGTTFGANTTWAFFAQNIEVKSSVYLRNVDCKKSKEIIGHINFDGAIILGRIDAIDADEEAEGNLNFGSLFIRDAHVHGEVIFRAPNTKGTTEPKRQFHGEVDLSGSVFESSIKFFGCWLKRGVRIYSSRIKEDLEFTERTRLGEHGANVDSQVYLTGTRVDGALVFTEAESHIPIIANSIRVGKDLFLGSQRGQRKLTAYNYIRLDGAYIRGNLDARGAEIDYKGLKKCDNQNIDYHEYLNIEDYAIYAPRLDVKGHVYLSDGFMCRGPVNLASSKIGGHIDCRGGEFNYEGERCLYLYLVEVERSVLFGKRQKDSSGCVIKGGIQLRGAHIRGELILSGAEIEAIRSQYGVDARSIRVDLDISMGWDEMTESRFKCKKSVILDNAIVGGDLDCRGGSFEYTSKPASSDSSAPPDRELLPCNYSLHAVGIQVVGSVYLGSVKIGESDKVKRSEFKGSVNFALAKVGIRFDCAGGNFEFQGDRCLYAPQMRVGRRVVFERLIAKGIVDISGAKIGGDLDCAGADLTGAEHRRDSRSYSILARGVKVDGSVYLNDCENQRFQAKSTIDFSGSTIGGRFVLKCKLGEEPQGGSESSSQPPASLTREGFLSALRRKWENLVSWLCKVLCKGNAPQAAEAVSGDSGTPQQGRESGARNQEVLLKLDATKIVWNLEIKEGSVVYGTIKLNSASIDGNLECHEGNITIHGDLKASNIKVGNNVYLGESADPMGESADPKPTIKGEIDLSDSEIGHSLKVNARFKKFLLRNSSVNGEFVFRGEYEAEPAVDAPNQRFSRAGMIQWVAGLIQLVFASLRSLCFGWGLRPFENFFGDRNDCEPSIDLSHSSVRSWEDTYAVSPHNLRGEKHLLGLSRTQLERMRQYKLEGFTYENLGSNLMEVLDRKPARIGFWLNLSNMCRYQPQPYEHMVGVLKEQGLERAWAQVIAAKRRAFRQHASYSLYTFLTVCLGLMGVLWPLKSILIFKYILILIIVLLVFLMIELILERIKKLEQIRGYIHDINLLFYRCIRLIIDIFILYIPVYLVGSPWRAALYAGIIWLGAGTIYSLAEKNAFAPAEGHVQFYIAKKEVPKAGGDSHTGGSDVVVHYHEPLDYSKNVPPGYPEFRPFVYALDNFVPFLELGQDDAWIPNSKTKWGKRLWYLNWFLMAAGIYLPTVVLGAITGLVKVEKL